MKKIIFAVTNDIVHDRRMQRICMSLAQADFDVLLIGRGYGNSPALPSLPFRSLRMKLWFRKGKFFYIEYQIRLLIQLIITRADIFCAVDLDTILPVTLVGWLNRVKRVYDAHELYTEVPELAGRPGATWIWEQVGKWCVPKMDLAYTVGPALGHLLQNQYNIPFEIIRNLPYKTESTERPILKNKILWYHGALNKGRGLEVAIRAMKGLPGYHLWLAGEGDLSGSLRGLAATLDLQDRVLFLGWVKPEDLVGHAAKCSIGLNLLDASSLSYYYSLANKSFDYIQVSLPALHMDFPEYKLLQNDGPIGVLLSELSPESVINAVRMLEDEAKYLQCQAGCHRLATSLHWEMEEQRVIKLYRNIWDDRHAHG